MKEQHLKGLLLAKYMYIEGQIVLEILKSRFSQMTSYKSS